MNDMNKILKWVCGIGLIVGAILVVFNIINGYKNTIDELNYNNMAMHDTIEMVRLENGNLLYEKHILLLKEEDITNQLDISKSEINDLKKKLKSSLDMISKLESNIKIDTIYTVKDSIIYTNGDYEYYFSYNNPYIQFNGETKIGVDTTYTNIYNINIPTNLTIGTTTDHKFFVESDNPYLKINDIKGGVINYKKPHTPIVEHGINFGIGVQYGICGNKFDIGPYIGYGVNIKF